MNLSNGLRRVDTATFAFGTIADKIGYVSSWLLYSTNWRKEMGKGWSVLYTLFPL